MAGQSTLSCGERAAMGGAEDDHAPFLLDLTCSAQRSGGLCATELRRPTANWRESEDHKSLPHPIEPYRDWTALGACTRCMAVYEAQHRWGGRKFGNSSKGFISWGVGMRFGRIRIVKWREM